MTGETPNPSPLDVLLRCITTGRWSAFMEDNEPERQAGLAALAQVEALAEAAQPLTGYDLHACQWIYLDPDTAFRGLLPEDADRIIEHIAALRAALVPFAKEGA